VIWCLKVQNKQVATQIASESFVSFIVVVRYRYPALLLN